MAALGREAYRDGRTLAVRRDGQILFLSYTPTGNGDDDDPDKALRVATAVEPLKLSATRIECDPVAKALVDEFGPVDHILTGAGVDGIGNTTVKSQLCTVAFADGGEAEIGVAPAAHWKAWVAAKRAAATGAAYEQVSLGEQAAFDTGDALTVDDGDQPLRVTTDGLPLSPAAAARARVALAEAALGS